MRLAGVAGLGNTGAVELGEELGRGLRSVVYAWGAGDVVKVANPSTPDEWLVEELRLMDAVARSGASVPGRRRLVEIDGRPALATERIDGPSMWDLLVDEPQRAAGLGADLAEVQLTLAACAPSYELPAQRDRLVSKIHLAAARLGPALLAALDRLPADAGPLVTCHGDLHASNVLLSDRGPVVVDWFDASRGSVAGEIARTALMLEHTAQVGAREVPAGAVDELRERYVVSACERTGIERDELAPWHLVHRVARLGEGLGDEHVDGLLAELV